MEKLKAEKKDGTYEVYDQHGRQYAESQREYYSDKEDPTKAVFENLLAENVRGKVVADIGAGAGDELLTYAKMGASKVIGVEPSSAMRQIAAETVQESEVAIELVDGDFEHLPLEDESVDVVTARYSLHIIPTFSEAFKEVRRVLKPGGRFIAAVAHPEYDARVAEKQGKEIGEDVELSLFRGGAKVKNATHTLEEYTGEEAQEYFDYKIISEYGMSDENKLTDLVIEYRKKNN